MELIKQQIKNTVFGEPKNCPVCGKEYILTSIGPDRFKIQYYTPQCNCEKELEAKKNRDRIEKEQKEKDAIALSKRFDNCMLSKRLRKMNFESLDADINTKEIYFCKKYVNEFNVEEAKGIQMLGNTGVGKSALMACVCNGLIKKGYNCLFTTLSSLISDFVQYSGEHFGGITHKINWLLKYDFIVLDDIGRENITDKRKEILFQIVDALYNEEKIVAFTANPEMIMRLKQDKELTAILDRLRSMCPNVFKFQGESLR